MAEKLGLSPNVKVVAGAGDNAAAAVGTGVSIINRDMLAADDYEGIAQLARRHVDAIKNFKKA